MSTSTTVTTEEDSSELKQFREQWKDEVRRRRLEELQQAQFEQGTSAEAHHQRNPETHTRSHIPHPPPPPPGTTEAKWSVSSTSPPPSVHTSHGQSSLSPHVLRAVEVYRRAVQHEQESNLDEAIRLYRQAFRIVPDVDRAYFKEEQRLIGTGMGHKKATAAIRGEEKEGGDNHLARTSASEAKEPVHMNKILSKVLGKSLVMLTFEPEDDREGVPINMIPEELLLCILRMLDTTTLERFATVSRKARVLSLDPLLWRDFVYSAYKPPQIPEAVTVQKIANGYDSDYRQTYIQHPRLRLDGVYIAVCHYVRNGLGESAWVNVSHFVTYHRYLRFFPDGQVLSLLTNEDYNPALVIPMLKPSLRMKVATLSNDYHTLPLTRSLIQGFHIGDWRLEGTSVLISNLVENHPHPAPSAHPAHHSHVPSPPARYHFQMSLTLRSKPLGRWNKLDIASYASINIEDGEVVPLPLKHERSFWFSKVKSWQGY